LAILEIKRELILYVKLSYIDTCTKVIIIKSELCLNSFLKKQKTNKTNLQLSTLLGGGLLSVVDFQQFILARLQKEKGLYLKKKQKYFSS